VRTYAAEAFYDPAVLRTAFVQFESDDWERELTAFYRTDVEVPATLMIDGQRYRDVGVHFRGMSSFFSVPEGSKRSLNISLDFVNEDEHVGGYRTLNLLNSHGDATYLRSVLYLEAARDYIPAPKANYLRVVINGESWGIYVNAQQFNKDFVREWFQTSEGARWKVPGSPGGRGGLEYLGEDIAAYRRTYEIKSKDTARSWNDLVTLTRVLNTTPIDQLEHALAPILDIDGVLEFLALDVALVNGDGYWTRASDYSLYQDLKGRFHVIPHDANETWGPGRGGMRMAGPAGPPPDMAGPPPFGPVGPGLPGGGRGRAGFGGPGGGPGRGPGGGPELDPLVGVNDATKPLRSRLLAVPALRDRYLGYARAIATKWLDWRTLGPLVEQRQALIAADVRRDTRKLDSFEAFESGVAALRTFAERRRAYLLK
jgi:spore coat protein CotH